GHQVFTPVFDPFHRPAEPQRGEADEEVLRVQLAAHAEAAADVAFEELHRLGAALEHAGDEIADGVWTLGRHVQLEHGAAAIVPRNRGARLERHAGVAADRYVEFHH